MYAVQWSVDDVDRDGVTVLSECPFIVKISVNNMHLTTNIFVIDKHTNLYECFVLLLTK